MMNCMKIAYVTVKTPFGICESFIIPEIRIIAEDGFDLTVFPIRPDLSIPDNNIELGKAKTLLFRRFNPMILIYGCIFVISKPIHCIRAMISSLIKSRNIKILLKNISIMPRAFAAAFVFKKIILNIFMHTGVLEHRLLQ